MNLVGKDVAIMRLCMVGNTPTKIDEEYIGKALRKVVKIVHEFDDGLFLTDFFMPEHIDKKNHYCHYGFLVLDRHNFETINS